MLILSNLHHNKLGNIYKQIGEFQKAIDSYNTAIQVKPNNSNAHYNLGNIYKQLGEFKKAKENTISYYIDRTLEGCAEYDIAKVLYKMEGENF